MRRGWGTFWLLVSTVATAACASLTFDGPPSTGSATGTGTTTVTSTPIIGGGSGVFGDGSDGDLSIATGQKVVNTCHQISSAAGTTVTATNLTGFAAGGQLLLLQVAPGGTFASAATTTVDAATLGSGGTWEIARIVAVAGGTDSLTVDPLVHGYHSSTSTGALAQACTVPQFHSVAVAGSGHLTDTPWNGVAGGVVALMVSSSFTATTSTIVSAAGDGFRGGKNTGSSAANISTLDASNGDGGGKGEGLDSASNALAGRGARLDAAGGGDGPQSGGGGGGGAGDGGLGGAAITDANVGGYGGGRVSNTGDIRLLFGGGGGAGQQKDGTATAGAPGGGVLVIFARAWSNGGAVYADGDAQGTNASGDGGGGGGGGGTILLWTTGASIAPGNLHARGGAGGKGGVIGGGGGGGGGGVLYLHGFTTPTNPVGAGAGATGNNNGSAGTDGRVVILP